ncbi:MAG: hypothetical protein HYR63_03070 [Proteobacteria bacterium]|nr:hypothetical protein [Pseudomonadota bacterium]MBI3498443.1 hypothetical protein [Pseudomonadota bacterium]
MTASAARRITGISTPFGGLQWAEAGPSERDVIRRFILFLEDRRVLYNPESLEVESEVEHSVHQIREMCTKTLSELSENAFAVVPLRLIRGAARRYHDDVNVQFHSLGTRRYGPDHSGGFFMALGGFRAVVGQQVALLAAHYDIDVEGDLAAVLPDGDSSP